MRMGWEALFTNSMIPVRFSYVSPVCTLMNNVIQCVHERTNAFVPPHKQPPLLPPPKDFAYLHHVLLFYLTISKSKSYPLLTTTLVQIPTIYESS